MVRQIALQFAYRKRFGKINPDDDEIALAMAYILAESKRSSSARIKQLSLISIPYWIVQVSGSRSILLSAVGESSVGVQLSENKSISQVRRIISNETGDIKDIPDAVSKSLPLLAETETVEHHLRNLQDPSAFAAAGNHFVDVEPGTKVFVPDKSFDSQAALTVSYEYQTLIDRAKTRLGTLQALHRLTDERLTDRLTALDNVITSEMSRWERRHSQMMNSNQLRAANLREGLSDSVYRLKQRRKMEESALLAEFARETVELERLFGTILEDIRAVRQQIGVKDIDVPKAVKRYDALLDKLSSSVSTYGDMANSMKALADETLQRSSAMDSQLADRIREEEDSTNTQINELHTRLGDLSGEIEQKRSELNEMRKNVEAAVTQMDESVSKRTEKLRDEHWRLESLSMNSDSIEGLSPLTQVNIMTYVVTYNRGNPVVFTPILVPEDSIDIPYRPEPLSIDIEKFIQKKVKGLLKDRTSFRTAFEKATTAANVFQDPEAGKAFDRGIHRLKDRKVLGENAAEILKPKFVKLVGTCPQCGANIDSAGKFCPECGATIG